MKKPKNKEILKRGKGNKIESEKRRERKKQNTGKVKQKIGEKLKKKNATKKRRQNAAANTYADAALLLHSTGSVVQIGEQHRHLVVDRKQLVLTLLQLMFQCGSLGSGDVGCHCPVTQVGTQRVQTVHRLTQVLVAELNLHGALRLQNATPAQITKPFPSSSSHCWAFCPSVF